AYLMKFANLFVDLPTRPPVSHYEKGRQDYCRILIEHYGISGRVNDPRFLARSLESLVGHFDLTLREIEKVFTIMVRYYSSLPSNQLTNEFLIAMLAILKVEHPTLYEQLSTGGVSAV